MDEEVVDHKPPEMVLPKVVVPLTHKLVEPVIDATGKTVRDAVEEQPEGII
jgi:hypothetical protein